MSVVKGLEEEKKEKKEKEEVRMGMRRKEEGVEMQTCRGPKMLVQIRYTDMTGLATGLSIPSNGVTLMADLVL